MSIQDQRLAVISRVHQEWAAELAGKVTPDREIAVDGPSQYPEGVETLSAPADAQADLHRRTIAALEAAGLPAEWPAH